MVFLRFIHIEHASGLRSFLCGMVSLRDGSHWAGPCVLGGHSSCFRFSAIVSLPWTVGNKLMCGHGQTPRGGMAGHTVPLCCPSPAIATCAAWGPSSSHPQYLFLSVLPVGLGTLAIGASLGRSMGSDPSPVFRCAECSL